MSDSDTLRAVADRQAITEQIYCYCRSMDRIDAELGYTVWHEDGLAEYEGTFNGTGRGFIDWVCETHRGTLTHSHQITNIIIELDGDHAGSESYCIMAMRVGDADRQKQIMVWSRYVDRWSRRNGRWAIDKRVTIRDFDEIRDVTPLNRDPDWSRRDRNDPSYAVLSG